MIQTYRLRPALVWLLALPLSACGESDSDPSQEAEALRGQAGALFAPLSVPAPPTSTQGQARIDLGRRLFFDTRISSTGQVSCVTCHLPEKWGADGLPRSIGVDGKAVARNAPTVLNSSDQITQHWRGDRASLEAQAEGALGGAFGNGSKENSLARLQDLGYEPAFKAAFPDDAAAVSAPNYATAVADYERTLVTPSRFDRFLLGDDEALGSEELDGLSAFIELGCSGCHGGPLLGGKAYRTFGVVRPYWELTGSPEPDAGRFDVTQEEADRNVFKVPNLRNVEHTSPYFHDGSVVQLEEAVRIMAEAQLGRQLTGGEIKAVAAFLRTLSAPVPDGFAPPAGAP